MATDCCNEGRDVFAMMEGQRICAVCAPGIEARGRRSAPDLWCAVRGCFIAPPLNGEPARPRSSPELWEDHGELSGTPCEEHGILFSFGFNAMLRLPPSAYAVHCAATVALAVLEATSQRPDTPGRNAAANELLAQIAWRTGLRGVEDLLYHASEIADEVLSRDHQHDLHDTGHLANSGVVDLSEPPDGWGLGRGQW